MAERRVVWLSWLIGSVGVIVFVLFLAIILRAFLAFDFFPFRPDSQPDRAAAAYFQEKFLRYAAQSVGQPIEGYDASVLMTAFPGLRPEDFEGVETVEGTYKIQDGNVTFVRKETQYVTAAEDAITDKGFETLRQNAARRLELTENDRATTNELLRSLVGSKNLMESNRISEPFRVGETKPLGDGTLTVNALVEDSRCPIDVTCEQAGTVRVRVTFTNNPDSTTTVVEYGTTVPLKGGDLTLEEIEPNELRTTDIVPPETYEFTFSFIGMGIK